MGIARQSLQAKLKELEIDPARYRVRVPESGARRGTREGRAARPGWCGLRDPVTATGFRVERRSTPLRRHPCGCHPAAAAARRRAASCGRASGGGTARRAALARHRAAARSPAALLGRLLGRLASGCFLGRLLCRLLGGRPLRGLLCAGGGAPCRGLLRLLRCLCHHASCGTPWGARGFEMWRYVGASRHQVRCREGRSSRRCGSRRAMRNGTSGVRLKPGESLCSDPANAHDLVGRGLAAHNLDVRWSDVERLGEEPADGDVRLPAFGHRGDLNLELVAMSSDDTGATRAGRDTQSKLDPACDRTREHNMRIRGEMVSRALSPQPFRPSPSWRWPRAVAPVASCLASCSKPIMNRKRRTSCPALSVAFLSVFTSDNVEPGGTA